MCMCISLRLVVGSRGSTSVVNTLDETLLRVVTLDRGGGDGSELGAAGRAGDGVGRGSGADALVPC